MLRRYVIGREFKSRGGIIIFYLFFIKTSFSMSFFHCIIATYSVNVNFRDYLYMLSV